jgi:thiol-disulfide isomerase/thioredoxin
MVKWIAALMVLAAGCSRAPQVTTATSADVLRAVREPGAKVVLVNLWASWCGPCRDEFPDLVKLQRDYQAKGLRVILVSWDDKPETAARYLAKQGVTTPSFLKSSTEGDQKFLDGLDGRLTGVLPATVVFDGAGKAWTVLEGRMSYEDFERAVSDVLNQNNQEEK